jgi:GntR family transcriptional regulator
MKGTGASPAPLRLVPGSDVPPRRQIALWIAGRIHDGAYDRGQRLPSVRALGARLDVHPDTVLAAYRTLERAGLVRTVPGGGVFVRSRVPPLPELLESELPGLGLRLASLGAALRLRRLLVLAHESELGAIVAGELEALLGRARVRVRRPTTAPLAGLEFGWLPIRVRVGTEAVAARVDANDEPTAKIGAALLPIGLPVGPGERLLARLASLRFPAVVGIVSASASVRNLARESVGAVAGPDVGVVTAAPGDGPAMRRVRARATHLVTDAGVRSVAMTSASRRPWCSLRLVPAAFGAELLDLIGREGTDTGSER